MESPTNIEFSPDGRYMTYLLCPQGSKQKALFAMDLETKDVVQVRKPAEASNTEETLSLEEKLRRERQRQLAVGVTEYYWSPNASSPAIVVPLQGNLYITNSVTEPLRPLCSSGPTEGMAPQISPDGKFVAFLRKNEVWVAPMDGSTPARQVTSGFAETGRTNGVADFLAQEEMDRYDGFWWSPDSSKIAFEEVDESHIPVYRIVHQGKDTVGDGAQEDHRYPFAGADNPHVRLGVVGIAPGSSVSWMDLGPNLDLYLARVNWLPSGLLTAQLQNRAQTTVDLVGFHPESGSRFLIVREHQTTWVNLHDMFVPVVTPGVSYDDPAVSLQFLWASERTGFRHLYLYQLNPVSCGLPEFQITGDVGEGGGAGAAELIRQVTGGQFVVQNIAGVDASSRLVYFHSNLGSPLYRHLARAPLDGTSSPPTTFGGPGYVHPDRPRDHYNVQFDASVAEVPGWAWAGDDNPSDLRAFGIERVSGAPGFHAGVLHPHFTMVADSFNSTAVAPHAMLYSLEPPGVAASESAATAAPGCLVPGSPFQISAIGYPESSSGLTDSSGPTAGAGAPDAGADAVASESASARAASAASAAVGGLGKDFTPKASSYDPGCPKTEPQLVAFASSDKQEVLFGALYLPSKPDASEPFPVIVSVYGGPGVQRVYDRRHLYHDPRAHNLRNQGFAVLMVDNRGSFNRGKQFEDALHKRMGTVEVDDQACGVMYLRRRGLAAEHARVGVYGWSYGGYMTLMCLAKRPDVFGVGVSGAPVTDWDGYDTHYTERYMSTPALNPEGYAEGSVMTHAKGIDGNLMLVHGLIDENVHFRHTARLINALIADRIRYDLLLFPEERHSPRRPQDRKYMEERIAQYFIEHMLK